MKTVRQLLVTTFLAFGVALPASAVTSHIDYSDLWYNAPAESQAGWGVNVAQQGDVIFATMFIYDQANQPHWYVASNVNATGATTFSGQLFNIGSGTYFGAPWVGISGVAPVGNIAFTFNTPTTGSMTYTINNVQVTKQIVRQSWRVDNLSGRYIGGVVGSGSSGCGQFGVLINGDLTISHAQPNITFSVDFFNNFASNCTFSGQYSQVGSVGSATGSYQCTCANNACPAFSGTFTMSELRNTRNGLNGRITGSHPNCNYNGFVGGYRDVL